jgi:hypothetical protein
MAITICAYVCAVTWGGVRGALADWAPAAEIAVAVGTLLLALATFRLAGQAKTEAAKVTEQVGLEREQLVAAQRPFAVPVIEGWGLGEDVPLVVLMNAGAGPAINVRGSLYWIGGAGGASQLLPAAALAPGEDFRAVVLGEGIDVNWAAARGFVRYHDLARVEWQTHFAYRALPNGGFYIEVLHVGTTDELGEPEYNPDQGWLNAPSSLAPQA